MRWFVDGNNVMGAGGDGWWNDPDAAAARLLARIASWTNDHVDEVVVVFDGAERPALAAQAGGLLTVDHARRRGRDAADDRIVELVDEAYVTHPDLTVVTSDRGLVARLPPGVEVEGRAPSDGGSACTSALSADGGTTPASRLGAWMPAPRPPQTTAPRTPPRPTPSTGAPLAAIATARQCSTPSWSSSPRTP